MSCNFFRYKCNKQLTQLSKTKEDNENLVFFLNHIEIIGNNDSMSRNFRI